MIYSSSSYIVKSLIWCYLKQVYLILPATQIIWYCQGHKLTKIRWSHKGKCWQWLTGQVVPQPLPMKRPALSDIFHQVNTLRLTPWADPFVKLMGQVDVWIRYGSSYTFSSKKSIGLIDFKPKFIGLAQAFGNRLLLYSPAWPSRFDIFLHIFRVF